MARDGLQNRVFQGSERFCSMYPLQKSQEITVLATPAFANAKTPKFLLRNASAHSCVCQWTRSSKIARIGPKIVRDPDFCSKIALFWKLLRRAMARDGLQNRVFSRFRAILLDVRSMVENVHIYFSSEELGIDHQSAIARRYSVKNSAQNVAKTHPTSTTNRPLLDGTA